VWSDACFGVLVNGVYEGSVYLEMYSAVVAPQAPSRSSPTKHTSVIGQPCLFTTAANSSNSHSSNGAHIEPVRHKQSFPIWQHTTRYTIYPPPGPSAANNWPSRQDKPSPLHQFTPLLVRPPPHSEAIAAPPGLPCTIPPYPLYPL